MGVPEEGDAQREWPSESGPRRVGEHVSVERSWAPVRTTVASELDDAGRLDPEVVRSVLREERFDQRYAAVDVLGRGGMGEVRLYLDRKIGRDVAHKTLRDEVSRSALSLERFVREARVQGQLEHPAVVPVYDLGIDPDGRIFFTMKRIRGTALDAVLDGRAAGDEAMQQRYSRRKLLSAFVQVCLAVDFAHSRGVLHRDLKPSNVMLGDYGEVHVLDWGLAKVLDQPDDLAPSHERGVGEGGVAPASATLAGSILGTPGYMSPEQARGDTDGLDARTDVYSLGAILFEIVFREALHEGNVPMRMVSTLSGAEMRASHRKHGADVPPELEALCKRACAIESEWRFPSARALAEAVERFLDGERDEERRRELAEAHVVKARELVKTGDDVARTDALRELGRALVLDPTHGSALRELEALLSNVPDEPPPAARRDLEQLELAQRRDALRNATLRHGLWVLIATVAFATLPVHDAALASGLFAGLVGVAGLSVFIWRFRASSWGWWSVLVAASGVAMGLLSLLFGAFIFVPAIATASTVFFAPQTNRARRVFVHVVLAAALFVPVGLGVIGWLPDPYEFQADGTMILRSPVFDLEGGATLALLSVANVLNVVVPGSLIGRFFDRLRRAETRNALRSWWLRQLLPKRD